MSVGPAGHAGDEDVAALLRTVLDAAQEDARPFGAYATVWTEIARSVQGGKRFRARIVLRSHELLGGRHHDAAVSVAAAFEVLHTAFLIHDDLIDGDTVRRGEANLVATMFRFARDGGADEERAWRWAQAAALLAGDVALNLAHGLVAGVDVPRAMHGRLLELFTETVFVSAAGELSDSSFGLGLHDPTMDEALAVADAKTAMYSFQAPLRAGAVLAGAGQHVVDELDVIGRLLGRAFQLVDDLQGVFSPTEHSGKSNLSDLREGKRTPLILHARSMPVWSRLHDGLGRPDLAEDTATELRRALASSDAPDRVQDQVRDLLDDVERRAGAGVVPAALTGYLGSLAAQVAESLRACADRVEAAR